MAKLVTLRDDFNDNATNGALWTDSGTVAESGGRAVLTPINNYSYRIAIANFDLTNSEVVVEVPTVTNTGTTGTLTTGLIVQTPDGTKHLNFEKLGASLQASKTISGTLTSLFGSGGTYSTSTYRWWRIRESAGVLYLEYASAAAPTVWTLLYSGATPFDFSSVVFAFISGYVGTESSPGIAEFNTINPILLRDLAGNAMVSFADMAVSNVVPITASETGAATDSGSVVVGGVGLRDLAGNLMAPFADMAVTNVVPIAASETGSGSDSVTAQSRSAAEVGATADAGSVATSGSGVGLRDLAGNLMAPFADMAVTNNTPTTVVSISASDTASGADLPVAQTRTVTDQGGTGVAPNVYDGTLPYDAGILYDSPTIPGSGENATATIAVITAETGTGSEAVIGQTRLGAESGSGVEGSTSIAFAAADLASGLDAGASAGLASSETGIGADAFLMLGLPATDLGVGADTASNQTRTASDAGAGTESAVSSTAFADSDSGAGSDSVGSLVIAGAGARFDTDSGVGAEASAAVLASASATDTGTAAESGFVVITGPDVTALSSGDTGGAAEAGLVLAEAAALADTASGSDAAALIALSADDQATGIDATTAATASFAAGPDIGVGSDLTAELAVLASDSGVGIDQFPSVTVPVLTSDAITVVEFAFVTITAGDVGVGAEDSCIDVMGFDAAVGIDQFPLLLASVSTGELAAAAEAVAVGGLRAVLSESDSAVAFDEGGHTFDPPTIELRSVVVQPRIVSVLIRESETV